MIGEHKQEINTLLNPMLQVHIIVIPHLDPLLSYIKASEFTLENEWQLHSPLSPF